VSEVSERGVSGPRKKATTFHSAHVPYVQIVIIAPIAQQRGNKNLVKAKAQPIIADNWDCALARSLARTRRRPRVIAPSALFNFATAAVS
jgi:hypothetical protein